MTIQMGGGREVYGKPCPFCGKEVGCARNSEECLDLCSRDKTVRHTIVCNFLRGGCGATCGFHDTPEAAVEAWNRRAEVDTL